MDEEKFMESNSSMNTNPRTEEENSELKTTTQTTQQNQTSTVKQLTLQSFPRPTRRDSEAMEDKNGILVHGPSSLGPRTLLYIIEKPQKSAVKVSQSQGVPEQNKSAFQNCSDQLT